MSLIAVVMKAPNSATRFRCASSLLDFGFVNFSYKKLINKNDIVKNVNVNKGVISNVNVIAENDVGALISKRNDINIEQKIELPDLLSAPIKKGDVVGKITYTLSDEIIGKTNLLADRDIDKIGFLSMEGFVLNKWFSLLR